MDLPIILPTLENEQVAVEMVDTQYIRLESWTVASILNGESKIEDYEDGRRFGGKAIKLALKYCKQIGEIKTNLQCPEFKTDEERLLAFEDKCIAVNKDLIVEITKPGMGMVHEVLAVSVFLKAFHLTDLTCQCLFDDLAFKKYATFREAFAFQVLHSPYFNSFNVRKIEHVLDGILKLPNLAKINSKFEHIFPFLPKDLELAKSENKSVRVDGNLEYKTNESSLPELFIKIEYMTRRMSSLFHLSMWLKETSSKYISQSCTYIDKFFNGQPADISSGKLHMEHVIHASAFHLDITLCLFGRTISQKIENPCKSYEDINAIADDIDDIEFEMLKELNEQKNKADNLTKTWLAQWQNDHPNDMDTIFPHLTYYLEQCYRLIYSVLCSVRGWRSPQEVQHHFNMSNICKKSTYGYEDDPNEDEDVESEGSVSQISIVKKQIRDDVKRLQALATHGALNFKSTYEYLLIKLPEDMQQLAHIELLLKDGEILTFICKEKFMLYMRASDKGAGSKINFAVDKNEFDRIKEETYLKFSGRGLEIKEAMEKYFAHYQKFHGAMVDETERQMKLHSKVEKRSKKRKCPAS